MTEEGQNAEAQKFYHDVLAYLQESTEPLWWAAGLPFITIPAL
jgi:hypothetical protein